MKANLPKLDFTTFILSVSSAAFGALVGESGIPADQDLARQNIDLLEMLQEKTRGNLTAEESGLLQQLLFQVRMKYVESSGDEK